MRTVEEQYQKKTPIEHILLRPDTYIGSVELDTQSLYTFSSNQISLKTIDYVPGLYKIFDEILVNAADNKIRDPQMSYIKVLIDPVSNYISVENDGQGIPIVLHKKENVYIPELIFGQLLTSSNYDDNEKKVTGGRNGYGAKLCNIFSDVFVVETRKGDLFYRQRFSKNMSVKQEPLIENLSLLDTSEIEQLTANREMRSMLRETTLSPVGIEDFLADEVSSKRSRKSNASSKKKPSKSEHDFTRITFKPDLKRFGLKKISEPFLELLHKRVYDMCATVPGINVYLNSRLLPVKTFEQYCKLYFNDEAVFCHEKINNRWEVIVTTSDEGFQQVSFVNSICTTKGGTHVTHVVDQLLDPLVDHIKKKEKGLTVKPAQIKGALSVFINCLVENPSFDSQTKENLTLHARKFGSKCAPLDNLIKNILKTSSIMDRLIGLAKQKQSTLLKKTDGSRSSRLTGIPKLDDANMAGTKNGYKCTLILTEGDSAKTLAVAGLSVVGRDYYGVFPLRGKLLNVRDASTAQIVNNAEITALKKILGLQHAREYTDTSALRYGHVMIMTDQDHDGSHIKGLLINFFDIFYPSLLKIRGFLQEFITPIVRASLPNRPTIDFFTLPEFYEWQNSTENSQRYKIKYYKGLGTSTSADAKYYFSNLPKHVKNFGELTTADRDLLAMAFSKKHADRRKGWLGSILPGTFLDNNPSTILISDFVNKELILFSMADNIRSIPSMVDGLKPGQRKVIFSCFKRNLRTEIKVAQLAGYVAENSAYHHGEMSLCGTIINLAQTFVGSNNVNLLTPSGQFGTRLQGGKDAASPRYLFTALEKITRLIFRQEDDGILNYLNEDNESIEPEYYVPVIPMVLVNGPEGIGTGWSSTIPNYNVLDIIKNIRRMLNSDQMQDMIPYYKGFRGKIEGIETRTTVETPAMENQIINCIPTPNSTYETNSNLTLSTLNIDLDPSIASPSNLPLPIPTPIANRYSGYTKFQVSGEYTISDSEIVISELPIGTWTQNYKEFLETLVTSNVIKDFKEYHTENTVLFKLLGDFKNTNMEKKLKLQSTISLNNLVCFDKDSKIKRYSNPLDIIHDFYEIRLRYYTLRKESMLKILFVDLKKIENKVRFIKEIVNETLIINKRKKFDIEIELQRKNYDKFEDNYDYLLNMAIMSLTSEKIKNLEDEKIEKEKKYDLLRKLSNKDLWRIDLDELEEEYKKEDLKFRKILEDEEEKRNESTFGLKKQSKKQSNHSDSKKKNKEGPAIKENSNSITAKGPSKGSSKSTKNKEPSKDGSQLTRNQGVSKENSSGIKKFAKKVSDHGSQKGMKPNRKKPSKKRKHSDDIDLESMIDDTFDTSDGPISFASEDDNEVLFASDSSE